MVQPLFIIKGWYICRNHHKQTGYCRNLKQREYYNKSKSLNLKQTWNTCELYVSIFHLYQVLFEDCNIVQDILKYGLQHFDCQIFHKLLQIHLARPGWRKLAKIEKTIALVYEKVRLYKYTGSRVSQNKVWLAFDRP